MDDATKNKIDILYKEYESLENKDRQLTSFYLRFSIISLSIIAILFYNAFKSDWIFLTIPFIIPCLLLFLLFWRVETVKTNVFLNKLEDRINKIARTKLLIKNQIQIERKFYIFYPPHKIKILNPMFILSIILSLVMILVLLYTYTKIYESFQDFDDGLYIFIAYSFTSVVLISYSFYILISFELKRKVYEFWENIAEIEYSNIGEQID